LGKVAVSKSYQGWSLNDREPAAIASLLPFYDWAYHHYFRVQTSGWEQVTPNQPALFVGSHNGGLAAPDMHMFIYDWYRRFGYDHPAYGLMHPNMWTALPPVAEMAAKLGAVRAHPKMAIAALRQGASVLVYPGGARDVFRPANLSHQIHFRGHKGFIKLALRQKVPIVPLVSWGAHATLMILADCYEQAKQLHRWGMPWLFNVDPSVFPIYWGCPWGLMVGPAPNIPWPVQIHTRVCTPIWFENYGRETLTDAAYIDACYQQVVAAMQGELDQLVAACK
jgi:1-acyl-sn-glycerol-3-phosphate acyltransferase